MNPSPPNPNPKRVAAGRLNGAKRGPLTPDGLARLRAAALRDRPWEHSTGPRTPAGKAKAALNGTGRAKGVRAARREVAALKGLFADLHRAREALGAGT
jgi:hypothetical protein